MQSHNSIYNEDSINPLYNVNVRLRTPVMEKIEKILNNKKNSDPPKTQKIESKTKDKPIIKCVNLNKDYLKIIDELTGNRSEFIRNVIDEFMDFKERTCVRSETQITTINVTKRSVDLENFGFISFSEAVRHAIEYFFTTAEKNREIQELKDEIQQLKTEILFRDLFGV